MSSEPVAEGLHTFTIQQVSRLTGLSEHTLRYYEKIGLIDPVVRDSSSRHRRYGTDELTRIESLAHLRAVGLTIDEMRTMMHSRGHSVQTVDVKLGLLSAHRRRLDTEIAGLEARRRFLDNRIDYWQAVLAEDTDAIADATAAGERLSRQLT